MSEADDEYWQRTTFSLWVATRDLIAVLFAMGLLLGAGDLAFTRALFADVARDRMPGAARTRALFDASFALALGLSSLMLCEIGGALHPLSRWACWEVRAAAVCAVVVSATKARCGVRRFETRTRHSPSRAHAWCDPRPLWQRAHLFSFVGTERPVERSPPARASAPTNGAATAPPDAARAVRAQPAAAHASRALPDGARRARGAPRAPRARAHARAALRVSHICIYTSSRSVVARG